MTNAQKWAVIVGLFLVALLGGVFAQQQFSGGQAVTVTSGTVTANAGTGPATAWKVDLGSTTANATAIKVDPSAVTSPVSLASLPALAAGTAKVGITYPLTGCGTTAAESGSPVGFAALSASTATVFSSTTCLLTFIISNTGAASLTYYVTDNAGTPVSVIGSSGNPITLLPGERDEYTFSNGSKFNAGVKLTASAATGAFYMYGVQ